MYKQIIFFSLTLLIPQIHFASAPTQVDICQQKQLQLHFDINKTIIATDAVQGKNLETTINGILAEFTFAPWDGKHEQSYYAYITDQIARENLELSRADETFKEKRSEHLKEFPDYLKRQHPSLFVKYEHDKTKMLKILDSKEMVIFPSFYKTIKWLDDNCPKKYTLYLRTFGQDLPEVIPAVEKKTSLRFTGNGAFQGTNLVMTIPNKSLLDFTTDPGPKHYAIRDDYTYWKSKGFQAAGGKPFPIDLNNPNVISIFFDDNANDPDKPIIHPIGPNEKLEDTDKLLKLGNIVAVNPKEAILDEDYFINKIKALVPEQK